MLTRIRALLWDARITWRLDNQHLRPFHDAPDDVVARWSSKPNRGQRHELVIGIAMAKAEHTQRQHRWRDALAQTSGAALVSFAAEPVATAPAPGILAQENASGHQPDIHPCVIDNVPRFADAPELSRDQALRRWALEDAARACDAVDDGCEGEWGHAAQACAAAIRELI